MVLSEAPVPYANHTLTQCLSAPSPLGMGLGQGFEPGSQALGDRQDYRSDVERSQRGREARIYGRIRG